MTKKQFTSSFGRKGKRSLFQSPPAEGRLAKVKGDIFTYVRQEIPYHLERLLREFAPGGEVKGQEYVALNPLRVDHHMGSFHFNIAKGVGHDFATGWSGDLIKLVSERQKITSVKAAQLIAEKINSEKGGCEEVESPQPQERKTGFKNDISIITPISKEIQKTIPIEKGGSYCGGIITDIYPYKDDTGILFYTFRFDSPDHTKGFGWLSYGRYGNGNEPRWLYKAPPKPRPLYGLKGLYKRPEAPVLVTEGEKATLAAHNSRIWKRYTPITSSGGARGAQHSDWQPLKGRTVLIAPDNDEPGRHYASSVAQLAFQAGATSVEIISWPEHYPKGWDIADGLPHLIENYSSKERNV